MTLHFVTNQSLPTQYQTLYWYHAITMLVYGTVWNSEVYRDQYGMRLCTSSISVWYSTFGMVRYYQYSKYWSKCFFYIDSPITLLVCNLHWSIIEITLLNNPWWLSPCNPPTLPPPSFFVQWNFFPWTTRKSLA